MRTILALLCVFVYVVGGVDAAGSGPERFYGKWVRESDPSDRMAVEVVDGFCVVRFFIGTELRSAFAVDPGSGTLTVTSRPTVVFSYDAERDALVWGCERYLRLTPELEGTLNARPAPESDESRRRATELADAIKKGQAGRVRDILSQHPYLITGRPDVPIWMEMAVSSQAPAEVFQALIDRGCSVNDCGASTDPLLEWMVTSTKCGPAQYQVLLENGADLGKSLDRLGECKADDADKVRELLREHAASLPFVLLTRAVALTKPSWGYRSDKRVLDAGPVSELHVYVEAEDRRSVLGERPFSFVARLTGPADAKMVFGMVGTLPGVVKQFGPTGSFGFAPSFPPGRYHYTVTLNGRLVANDWFTLR